MPSGARAACDHEIQVSLTQAARGRCSAEHVSARSPSAPRLSAKERMDRPRGEERRTLLSKVTCSPGDWGRRGWGCAERRDGTELAFGLSVEARKELIHFTEMGIEDGSC